LRGSASRLDDMAARHIVSAFDQYGLIVLGHVEVAEKSNEIPAAQDLIESLGLEGRVFTMDALHCQKKTLALAREKGADVLVQVKGNQPTLLAACEGLASYCAAAQCNVQHKRAHGRIETRIVRIWSVPENWLEDDWQPLVQQIVCVSRTVERRHCTDGWVRTSETAWWISTSGMSAATCQMAIRGHWSIENQNHHVRDVALREDHCSTRTKPGILARLRSMALNCMRATSGRSITIERHRNALNFEHLRRCVCGATRH
jgi:predicted transposase YbfD/YdcC